MSLAGVDSWSDEPAIGGWWMGVWVSVAALLLLTAGSIQQAHRLTPMVSSIFHPQNESLMQPERIEVAALPGSLAILSNGNSAGSTLASISDPEPKPTVAALPVVVPAVEEPANSLTTLRKTVLAEMTEKSGLVRFLPETATLTPESESLLQLIFEDLFLYSESDIVIEVASLDATTESANWALSQERALQIKEFLSGRGLESERLIVSVLTESDAPSILQHITIQANLDE